MWLVIKYKTNQINFLINNLKETIGELLKRCVFRKSKVETKIVKKIQTYFCWKIISFVITKKFSENSTLFNLKYLKGLKYYLDGFQNQQLEIQNLLNTVGTMKKTDIYLKNFLIIQILKEENLFQVRLQI